MPTICTADSLSDSCLLGMRSGGLEPSETFCAMSRELLGQVVTELYDRLGRDALLPTDFVSAGRITAPTPTSWILHAFDSGKQLHADAAVFRAFTREMGAILDIGAHWGYTALAIRQFGSSCPIVSFEPSETNAACLKILRKLDREFDFACIALGDSDEEVTLYTPVVNGVAITGLSSIDGVTLTAYGARHVVGHLGQLIPEAEFYDAKILKTKVRVRRSRRRTRISALFLSSAFPGQRRAHRGYQDRCRGFRESRPGRRASHDRA